MNDREFSDRLLTEIDKKSGNISLEFLRDYSLDEAKEYLLSLPGVGQKTAYCVLMYSYIYYG